MFVFYNPNPKNKSASDCVIRALSVVTGKSWDDVYLDVITQGYIDKEMPSVNSVWGNCLKSIGYRQYFMPREVTIKEFCKIFKRGEFVIGTGSHAVAVIDGDYYDTSDTGSEIVAYYWTK